MLEQFIRQATYVKNPLIKDPLIDEDDTELSVLEELGYDLMKQMEQEEVASENGK